jgi:hypothetical protein
VTTTESFPSSAQTIENAALNTLSAYCEAVSAMRVWSLERAALKAATTEHDWAELLPPDLAILARDVRNLPGPWTKEGSEVVDLIDTHDHANVAHAYATHYRLGTTTVDRDANT